MSARATTCPGSSGSAIVAAESPFSLTMRALLSQLRPDSVSRTATPPGIGAASAIVFASVASDVARRAAQLRVAEDRNDHRNHHDCPPHGERPYTAEQTKVNLFNCFIG
jgi:hypothetical protein